MFKKYHMNTYLIYFYLNIFLKTLENILFNLETH